MPLCNQSLETVSAGVNIQGCQIIEVLVDVLDLVYLKLFSAFSIIQNSKFPKNKKVGDINMVKDSIIHPHKRQSMISEMDHVSPKSV